MNGREARDDEREALVELDRIEEYAEQHGHPAFQDEGSAFLAGARWATTRKHPEPEITDEMVERAITAAWGDETWRDWNEQAVREEMDSMRRALEAALRVPVGEEKDRG